ncbi:11767_t:CDS:10, partial [Racocetra persica]
MELYKQVNNYFNEVSFIDWNIIECLYSIKNPTFTSANIDEVADVIKEVIRNHLQSNALLANAKRKLEHLESTFDDTWRCSEVHQYFVQLDLSHEVLNNGHTRDLDNSYSEKRLLPEPENIRREELFDHEVSEEDHEELLDYEAQVSEEEISTEQAMADPTTDWILSTRKNVSEILSAYREKIPFNKAYLYPAYFGILNLSEEDVEVPLYELMNEITEKLEKKPSDLITEIESCVIENNTKVNTIRRLIQIYAYHLQHLRLPMSEAAFGSNFTNMITKGILTFNSIYHYEKGEIQSLASSVITNMRTKPTDRSLIGQKVDFRISKDQFEMLIGLRSGGLPSAAKSRKWIDKVDLAVALQDVLLNEGIENNGVEPNKFHNLFTLEVHTF